MIWGLLCLLGLVHCCFWLYGVGWFGELVLVPVNLGLNWLIVLAELNVEFSFFVFLGNSVYLVVKVTLC